MPRLSTRSGSAEHRTVLVVPGYRQFGARVPEIGALANVLAHAGLVAPHTGRALSEAMLFGIAGGIGLGYFVYASGDFLSHFIATRVTTSTTTYLTSVCSRLGLKSQLQVASSASAVEKRLRPALAAGTPVITWLDPGALGYPCPAAAYHAAVVYGLDHSNDVVHIADHSAKPITIDRAQLATALAATAPPRFQTLVVGSVAALKPAVLKAAVRLGIRDGYHQMQDGFGSANFRGNFGLAAMKKWAGLLTDERDQRGWPKFLPPGPRLLDTLVSIYNQIEQRGPGSAMRELYAEFLREAAAVLGQADLEAVAAQFTAAGRLWHTLAEAMLPSRVPAFKEIKRLQSRRHQLFQKQGQAAQVELQHSKTQIEVLTAELRAEFPWDEAQTSKRRAAWREIVLALHAAEQAAFDQLARLVK